MKHIKPLLLKFFFISVIISIVFVFYGFSFRAILFYSAALAVVTYVLGDLIILPLTGNTTAVLVDGITILAGISLLFAPQFGLNFSLIGGALFCAIIVAVCESFLHKYVISNRRNQKEPTYE
ncbi:DUF2512 family protein [Anaerobacillus sp. MEB173]|uniref:DUF2512 family protein n=1 Tax=Anaerobacillus sp. MEB173 TaxID=3383345 RepID=UPI003F8E8F59